MQHNTQSIAQPNYSLVLGGLPQGIAMGESLQRQYMLGQQNRQQQQVLQQQQAQQKQAQQILGESLMQGATPLQTAQRLYQVNPEIGKQYLGFQQAQIENQQKQAQAQQEQMKSGMNALGNFTAQLNLIPQGNTDVKNAFYKTSVDSLAQNGAISPEAYKFLSGEWTPQKEQFLNQAFNQQMINAGQFKPQTEIGQLTREAQLGLISQGQAQKELALRNAEQSAKIQSYKGQNISNTNQAPLKLNAQENKRIADITTQGATALDGLDLTLRANNLLEKGIGGTGGIGGKLNKLGGEITAAINPEIRQRRQEFENVMTQLASTAAKTFGTNPSEYETKLLQKLQANLNNDPETNKKIIQEARIAMQKHLDKQEYIFNAMENGIKPFQAEVMFNKEQRQKINNTQQVPSKNQNSFTTKGGYNYTVIQ